VPVIDDEHVNWDPVWSPDGRYLYYVSDRSGSMNIWRVAVDESSGKVKGEPQAITTSSQPLGLLSIAQNGRQIVYATDERKSNLERWELDPATMRIAGKLQPITQGSRGVRTADVSPDGQWVAFDTSFPQEDLFVVRADGSGQRQLTSDPAKDRVPLWFPDGSRLLFYSNRSGGAESYGAWSIRADGSELQAILQGTPDPVFNPVPSPLGGRIVATLGGHGPALIDLDAAGHGRIQRMLPPAAGGETLAVTSWSPDGAYLAGTLERKDGGGTIPGIVVYELATGRYQRLTDTGDVPRWLHDSRTILYREDGKILFCDLRSKVSRLLLEPPQSSVFISVSAAPDDRLLYAVRSTDEGDILILTLAGGD
jgi:Tol biopolymer transport system component